MREEEVERENDTAPKVARLALPELALSLFVFRAIRTLECNQYASSYLREEPKPLKWEGDDAGARIGNRVAELEIDDDDCVRRPLRSLAARALAARRDDIAESRPEVVVVLVDADCAATERIERA